VERILDFRVLLGLFTGRKANRSGGVTKFIACLYHDFSRNFFAPEGA